LHIPNTKVVLKNPTFDFILKEPLQVAPFFKAKFKEKTALKEEEMRWPGSEMNHPLVESDFHDKGLQNYFPFFSFSAYLQGIKMVTSFLSSYASVVKVIYEPAW
jgi:hypothetical protein